MVKSNNKTLNKTSFILFSFLFFYNINIPSSFAYEDDTRYYDVEIIVFENTRPKYRLSELWKKNFIQIEPETYVQIGQPLPMELLEKYDPLLTFQYIENTAYRLNDIETSLNESNNFRVLLHSAWRQPGLSKDKALNVKIDHFISTENTENGDILINQNDTDNSPIDTEQINSNDNMFDTTAETSLDKEGFVLSGYIKLILSRYLHLKIDLIYHELKNEPSDQFFIDEFGEEDLLPDVFQIKQTRRLRSKELHYIDHPVISIIALITPYKVKKQ
jgi:hypothetical protein